MKTSKPVEKFLGLTLVWMFAFVLLASLPGRLHSRRPKSAEGKSSLAGIYMAEKAYFAEWGHYTTDMQGAGWAAEGSLNYAVGISESCRNNEALKNIWASSENHEPRDSGKMNSLQLVKPEAFLFSTEKRSEIEAMFRSFPCHPQFPQKFEAYAVGDLGGKNLDVWKITDENIMTNVTDGSDRPSILIWGYLALLIMLVGYIGLWVLLFKSPFSFFTKVFFAIILLFALWAPGLFAVYPTY